MIWLILTLWVVCGYLAYGYAFSYLWWHCPRENVAQFRALVFACFLIAALGPLALSLNYYADRFKYRRAYPWQVKHDRH